MAPSGESFRNTFFFLRMVQSFYRRYLQNTTNNVTGAQEDHDRSRYAAYSVNVSDVKKIWLAILVTVYVLRMVTLRRCDNNTCFGLGCLLAACVASAVLNLADNNSRTIGGLGLVCNAHTFYIIATPRHLLSTYYILAQTGTAL